MLGCTTVRRLRVTCPGCPCRSALLPALTACLRCCLALCSSQRRRSAGTSERLAAAAPAAAAATAAGTGGLPGLLHGGRAGGKHARASQQSQRLFLLCVSISLVPLQEPMRPRPAARPAGTGGGLAAAAAAAAGARTTGTSGGAAAAAAATMAGGTTTATSGGAAARAAATVAMTGGQEWLGGGGTLDGVGTSPLATPHLLGCCPVPMCAPLASGSQRDVLAVVANHARFALHPRRDRRYERSRSRDRRRHDDRRDRCASHTGQPPVHAPVVPAHAGCLEALLA